MKKSSMWGILVLFIILVLTSACASKSKLIGSWTSTDDLSAQGVGDLIFEFTEDDILRISVSGVSVNLNYEFVDSDTLRFIENENADALLAGQEVDFKIEGDTLTLISNDRPMLFTRMDPE